MYGCESWTVKKAERRRIDAFEVWCWRRLLRVPWTARRSNQSILKEISPEYSLEGLMLKLKLNPLVTWCKELTHWKRPWSGKYWRQEDKVTTEDEMVGWHHWLSGHEFEQAPGVGDGQGSLGTAVHGIAKKRTWLSNWTELNWCGRNGFRWFNLDWSFRSEYLNIFHGKQILNCIERCVTNICMMFGTYWSILQASNK